jgi:hypothetical protein
VNVDSPSQSSYPPSPSNDQDSNPHGFPSVRHREKASEGSVQSPHRISISTSRICGSRTAFRCDWSVKRLWTIFHAHLGECSLQKKRAGTRYTELVFLHPVGSAGNVMDSGLSRARNVNVVVLMLRWDWYVFHKKCVRTRYAELVFCFRWDL